MQAPGRATFEHINGYFDQPVEAYEVFVQRLVPSYCFDGGSKPTCSKQCQVALKILGLTSEHDEKIANVMEAFDTIGQQICEDYFMDPNKAEAKLQAVVASYICLLSKAASHADPDSRNFNGKVEPRTGPKFNSDIAVSHYQNSVLKYCILGELKYAKIESHNEHQFKDAFSQLMHAAALAYNANQWKDRLCCCLGSLTHWHLFLLKVVWDSERCCLAFRISHYNKFALLTGQVDWSKTWQDLHRSWREVNSMYKELLKHILLWLRAERFTPGRSD